MRIPTKYTNFPFSNIPYNRKKSWTPSYFYPLLRIWFFTFKKGGKKKNVRATNAELTELIEHVESKRDERFV